VLRTPKLEGDKLSFSVQTLEGDLSGGDGPAAVFIDIIGRPFTPLSFAGVARRSAVRGAMYAGAVGAAAYGAAAYAAPYYRPYPPPPTCGYYPYPPAIRERHNQSIISSWNGNAALLDSSGRPDKRSGGDGTGARQLDSGGHAEVQA
jgi:hypothetical protein